MSTEEDCGWIYQNTEDMSEYWVTCDEYDTMWEEFEITFEEDPEATEPLDDGELPIEEADDDIAEEAADDTAEEVADDTAEVAAE